MIMVMNTDEKIGVKILREMIEKKVISKYRLSRLMGVTYQAVQNWERGIYFDENKHLPRLCEIRDLYMHAKGMI